MELSDYEARLLSGLTSPRNLGPTYDPISSPDVMTELAAVGFDTNALVRMRRDPSPAEGRVVELADLDVRLVVPAQALIEFWNNHDSFAAGDWSEAKSHLTRAAKSLGSSVLTDEIEGIRSQIDELSKKFRDARSPEFLSRSQLLIQALQDKARVPMVSRMAFYALAQTRFESKVPPGFEDDNKLSPLGDTFVWADFLLGCLACDPEPGREAFLFVTDERKKDWRTGGGGHPYLLEEFKYIVGGDLTIVSYEAFLGLQQAPPDPGGVLAEK